MAEQGGSAAQALGTSLLRYLAGKKGYEREREIGVTASDKADPWAKQRKYYMGILGQMYGMPEGYGESAPSGGDDKSANPAENLLFDILGGKPESGDYGAYAPLLLGGANVGLFNLLNKGGGVERGAPTAANPNLGLLQMLGGL